MEGVAGVRVGIGTRLVAGGEGVVLGSKTGEIGDTAALEGRIGRADAGVVGQAEAVGTRRCCRRTGHWNPLPKEGTAWRIEAGRTLPMTGR